MIKADIIQSTGRIWPSTQSFKLSERHLFAEKASLTAAHIKGGALGRVGSWQVWAPGGCHAGGWEGQHPPSY